MTGQHQWPSAGPLFTPDNTVSAAYGFWGATDPADAAYTDAETLPPGVPALRGYGGTWWSFTPSAPPPDLADLPPGQFVGHGYPTGVYLDIWRVTPGGWVPVAAAQSAESDGTTAPGTPYTGIDPAGYGQAHYVRLAHTQAGSPATNYTLEAYYLFAAVAPLQLTAGPADAMVDTPGVFYGPRPALQLTAGPADAVIDAPVPGISGPKLTLAAPPADTIADAPAPTLVAGIAVPVAPIGVAVPGSRPVFAITATTTMLTAAAEIQWAADPAFTTVLGTAGMPAPPGLDDAPLSVAAGTDLPDGPVWWRTRIAGPLGAGTWSAPVVFAVSAAEGRAVAAGGQNVTTAAGVGPHLWHIDYPASGSAPGEAAVLLGMGFGTSPQVMLGDIGCDVVAVGYHIDGDGTDAPQIEPGGATTVEHQRITFTIPAVDTDHIGDAITVIRQEA